MIEWTEEALELGDVVRGGRMLTLNVPESSEEPLSLTIGYAELGGDGVAITLDLDGALARLWADEQAWCSWVAPLLAVQKFADVPSDLHGPLTQWALEPLCACVAELAHRTVLAVPALVTMETANVEPALACMLTLRRADATLRLRVLEWPMRWLTSFAQALEPLPDEPVILATQRLPLMLAAGCTRVTQQQLKTLSSGQAVLLALDASVESKEAWLVKDRPLARIRYLNEGEWQVNDVMDEGTWENDQDGKVNDEVGQDLDQLTFTIVAEIGRIELTLADLRTLERGMILGAPASFDGGVTLRANGRTIARGRLLRVGERLAVRIE